MTFCGGPTDESSRYVATVSGEDRPTQPYPSYVPKTDDKMLMVWDLHPTVDIPSAPLSVSPSHDSSSSPASSSRPQPTAYVISFPHTLSSVCAHASTTKDLLVADVRGSLALIDWRSDPSHAPADAWHHPRVLELAAPRAIAGAAGAYPASVAWQHANPDMYVSPLSPKKKQNQNAQPPTVSARCTDRASLSGTCPSYRVASRHSADLRSPKAHIVSGGVRLTPNISPFRRAMRVCAARRSTCTALCTPMPTSSRPRSLSRRGPCACATSTLCRLRESRELQQR